MYKQVIVLRTDLRLSRGKMAAQACHASWSAGQKANRKVVKSWEAEGQKKVVLAIRGERALLELAKKCAAQKLPHALIRDAGLTELPPGTLTALGIGPAEEKRIDKVSGQLKLLK